MPPFFRRLRARIKYWNHERDLAREIEAHREMAASRLAADGTDTREARAHASRLLGNATLAREDSRAVWVPRLFQQAAQDARYALRGFRRELGFTFATVTMLTLGLGVTIGTFTFFNGMFFKGWPVPRNHEVFIVRAVFAETAGRVDDGLSYGAYKHIAKYGQAADYVALARNVISIEATRDGNTSYYTPFAVFGSDNFIEALKIPLLFGTAPLPESRSPEPTVVISHAMWRTKFGSDPAILGRSIWVGRAPATVVGVVPPDFDGLDRNVAIYAPLWAGVRLNGGPYVGKAVADETACCVTVTGRVKPGWTREQVAREVDVLAAQYRASIRQAPLRLELASTAAGLDGAVGRGLAPVFAMTSAGVLFLLILTCANVGNLHLARSMRRQREIATRLALGAGRARLIRQLITEGLVLATMAGLLAFVAAAFMPAMIRASNPSASAASFGVDWQVAGFSALGVTLVCILVSLAPALRSTRVVWRGSSVLSTGRTGGLRGALLSVQIAITLMLLVSAALIARGVQFAVAAPTDFAMQTTTAAKVSVPPGTPAAKQAEWRASAIAAIRDASPAIGFTDVIPVSDNAGSPTSVRHPGAIVDHRIDLFHMSASAARVLDVRLVAGRWVDDDAVRTEAVINETLARRVFGDASPIGQPLDLNYMRKVYTVVGVSRDAHVIDLGPMRPIMHTAPLRSGIPVMLTARTPAAEAQVRALVAGIDKSLSVRFTPLAEAAKGTFEDSLTGAAAAATLGGLALVLAMIGIYGVFSYSIEERRREIGIRLALGAQRSQIRAAVFSATRNALIGGVAGGLVMSAIAGMLLRRYLYGMSPADPLSYGAVALILIVTALVATFVPIRKALRVNPAVTLRAD